jgi:hypothetical protein
MKCLAPLACLFAGPVAAQCTTSAPPFAGTPMFVSMSEASGNFPLGLLKCEGFGNAPIAWPVSTAPDFNFEVVLRALLTLSCSVPQNSPLPDIDALSLGTDWILATLDGTGTVSVPAQRWGALTFTVSPDSVGAGGTAGAAIRAESSAAEGPGADVFSYVLPGSVMPAHLLGRTLRAQDSLELGLPRARLSIDALDQYVSLYRADPLLISRGVLSPTPTLFFSVTAATLNRVPASWWANRPRSGAVIFATTWIPTARKWSCVQPWRSARELGLQDCEDVDALALDLARGHILFSTARSGCTAQASEIMYGWLATDGDPTPVAYKLPGGQPVSDAAGIGTGDDVKAICSLDPLAPLRGTSNTPNTERIATGSPGTAVLFPGVQRRMDASMFLTCWTGGAAQLETYGLGWPSGGPRPGVAAAYINFPGTGTPPVFLGAFARNPTNSFCGDPRSLRINVPAHVRLLSPAIRVEFAWVGLDTTTNALAQSFPVGLDL